MERIKKEKSILGAINDLSHRLVLLLVFPIIISLVLMLVYAWKYHSAIRRMEEITNIKTVVSEDIPERAWNIISGRQTFPESNIYMSINEVNATIEKITNQTGKENRLSLIVARRTMETLQNYVDTIRDNIRNEVPVVENEAVLVEVRDVSALVDSMLNEYIALEIQSTARMSMSLRIIIIVTAVAEVLIVVFAIYVRNKTMKATAERVVNAVAMPLCISVAAVSTASSASAEISPTP